MRLGPAEYPALGAPPTCREVTHHQPLGSQLGVAVETKSGALVGGARGGGPGAFHPGHQEERSSPAPPSTKSWGHKGGATGSQVVAPRQTKLLAGSGRLGRGISTRTMTCRTQCVCVKYGHPSGVPFRVAERQGFKCECVCMSHEAESLQLIFAPFFTSLPS